MGRISALGAPGLSWLPGAGLLAVAIVADPTATVIVTSFLTPAVSPERILSGAIVLCVGVTASIVSVGGSLGPLNRLDITS